VDVGDQANGPQRYDPAMRHGSDYWVKLVAVVAIGLLVSSIVGKTLGGFAGIVALVLYIMLGRVWLRPWILGRR
jgi:hypothetical protein